MFVIGCAVFLLFATSSDSLSAQMFDQGFNFGGDSSGRSDIENSILDGVMEDIESTAFDFSLDTKPDFPQPLEDTTIILNDYSMGTVGARIEWYVDGARVDGSDNKRSLVVKAPALGESKEIVAKLLFSSGRQSEASVTLRPVQIDVVAEPETRVPAFYRGRSLASQQSSIRLAAFVYDDNTGVPATGLSYKWETGAGVIDGGRLYEGNVIRFTPPMRREITVKLTVTDMEGVALGTKTVTIPLVQPQVSFYEVNPLRGQSLLAVQNPFIFAGPEISVRAEPYYISPEAYTDPRREIQWLVAGRPATNGEDPYVLSLQKLRSGGSSIVNFRFRNITHQTQTGEGAFKVQY